jgi:hypothetical protein
VDTSKQFQEILGFGAGITDSVGMNLGSLANEVAESLLR